MPRGVYERKRKVKAAPVKAAKRGKVQTKQAQAARDNPAIMAQVMHSRVLVLEAENKRLRQAVAAMAEIINRQGDAE